MIWQLMSRASRDGTGGRIYWCCRSSDLTKLLSTLKSSIDVLETALRKSARDIVALSGRMLFRFLFTLRLIRANRFVCLVLPALYEQVVQVMTLRSLFGKRSQASPPCVQSVLLQRMLSASPSDTLTIKQCAHSPTCGIERRAAATPTRVLNDTGKAIVKMLIDEPLYEERIYFKTKKITTHRFTVQITIDAFDVQRRHELHKDLMQHIAKRRQYATSRQMPESTERMIDR